MRRQRRTHQTDDMNTDDYQPAGFQYQSLLKDSNGMDDFLQMDRLPRSGTASQTHRFENTIEAKVEVSDTLQALALRFHCTVADIKRLNKIDKENEIHARKVVKIPVTVHSVLLETLPTVHTSGNNSPRSLSQGELVEAGSNIMRNPLEDANLVLSEKLMVASVNASCSSGDNSGSNTNNLIQHSKVLANNTVYTDDDRRVAVPDGEVAAPLLSSILDDEVETQRRPIRGPSLRAIDWSGSDCDMSWACLFVVILALCFAIPLIIVICAHPHTTASH